jgi:hypothetical protein
VSGVKNVFQSGVNFLAAFNLRLANPKNCVSPESDGITDFFVAEVTVYSYEENAIDFYIPGQPVGRGITGNNAYICENNLWFKIARAIAKPANAQNPLKQSW